MMQDNQSKLWYLEVKYLIQYFCLSICTKTLDNTSHLGADSEIVLSCQKVWERNFRSLINLSACVKIHTDTHTHTHRNTQTHTGNKRERERERDQLNRTVKTTTTKLN